MEFPLFVKIAHYSKIIALAAFKACCLRTFAHAIVATEEDTDGILESL